MHVPLSPARHNSGRRLLSKRTACLDNEDGKTLGDALSAAAKYGRFHSTSNDSSIPIYGRGIESVPASRLFMFRHSTCNSKKIRKLEKLDPEQIHRQYSHPPSAWMFSFEECLLSFHGKG